MARDIRIINGKQYVYVLNYHGHVYHPECLSTDINDNEVKGIFCLTSKTYCHCCLKPIKKAV